VKGKKGKSDAASALPKVGFVEQVKEEARKRSKKKKKGGTGTIPLFSEKVMSRSRVMEKKEN